MPTVRISHIGGEVEAVFEDGGPRVAERRPFSFSLTDQDAEDIRWYLEDYRIYPVEPTPTIAKRIEKRMDEVGAELFRLVLGGSDLWQRARERLGEARIEIETELSDALVPWELMLEPVADIALAMQVQSFVRLHSRPAMKPVLPKATEGKVRILLAICRLEDDRVPFRSVARHLIRGLSESAREPFELEVLRPPTFEHLARRLRAAKAKGEPFHVVHFDGHGLAGEVFFENPAAKKKRQSVKAAELGKLLHETGVPLLILNACRSADSEPPEAPETVGDLHKQVRQFGSFAHAVMDCGSTGVVAWRYSVFVDTAAQYMADLYAALASGLSLGDAATLARKQLGAGGRDITDWMVPVVFEAAPIRLFPVAKEILEIKLETRAVADSGLPQAPDVGFIGRDETILELDRMFYEQNIVLLHAYAGSGKSTTAAEFARWLQETGGLAGPVLFTSFEQHKLPRVLDELGRVFEALLAKNGIQWLTLADNERREIALQILRQIPVFWIWDNVEPIAGFPAGTTSSWTPAEQQDLAHFLSAARASKAKFLLTSRRDERDWLHDLPARIALPPMPFDECVQMTEMLAKKVGRRLDEVADWRPLIRFTQGNPLTLTVLVGQALRNGLKSQEQVQNFVRQLQTGEAGFEHEASEGRTRSLAASLSYGFEHAFTEVERKQLALLHLFQGFVDVDVLRWMGNPEVEWCLSAVKGFSRDDGITLLDRAAEVGLLAALGEGYYRIHPALPWFFWQLFQQHYASDRGAVRAFVEAMQELGNYYAEQYENGHRDVIAVLAAEEANLVNARSLARANGWWKCVIGQMQGLRTLHQQTGRTGEWARLVDEIVPDFVDPATGGPREGREDMWPFVTEYRVRLTREARRWQQAEVLQSQRVRWDRERVAATLARAPENWSAGDRSLVRMLAVSLQELSDIQRERGSSTCVGGYREAIALAESIQNFPVAAVCAFNLGHAYKNLLEIRDLTVAENWYRHSFERRAKEDLTGRARCMAQLGTVADKRFEEAKENQRSADETLGHLQRAMDYYQQALQMLPLDAPHEKGVTHNNLGRICSAAGKLNDALRHYRESIRHCEIMGDRFGSARARYNAGLALVQEGRFADARDWAQAALRDYEACENSDQDVMQTMKLLEFIESGLRGSSPPS